MVVVFVVVAVVLVVAAVAVAVVVVAVVLVVVAVVVVVVVAADVVVVVLFVCWLVGWFVCLKILDLSPVQLTVDKSVSTVCSSLRPFHSVAS